ncbi:MAG: uroporphyrinogen-III C-methyltransferase [Proteobacteria bacterium]|nr:uroporphyrinogen-III C-methyltransferase [Pseudomonadota bacterium]
MSKKKTTSTKKTGQAKTTTEDATFENKEDQPAASESVEKISSSMESAGPELSIPVTAPEAAQQKKSGGFVAWLALFAALLALAAFGVDFLGDRGAAGDNREDAAAITSSVRAMRESVASLEQNLAAMSGQLATRDDEIAAIERRFGDRLAQIESLPGRMSAIEGTVSSLQGISTGAKNAWLLAEAEYYMQIANAQLQLAGNPQLASLALGLADERILQLANPALTDVRRVLTNELRALGAMNEPDTEGVTLTLASLSAIVDSLPLRHDIALPGDEKAVVDPELTGTERAFASLRSAFEGIVSVRRADETLKPLIAPEAQYFLRANLALQLQAARLAMLRGEETIFQQSLEDAAAWLTEYYDAGSTPVQSALQTITDIRGSVFSVAVPDISESLRLLRQFNALANAIATPVVEPADGPEQ